MPDPRSLDQVLRVAGAVVTIRHGRRVAAHYGSAAGELAVCVRSVGLVDRSELSVLVLDGRPRFLDHAITRLVGLHVALGGSALVGGAWWCRRSHRELVVICEPEHAARVIARLRVETHRGGLGFSDHSEGYAPIGLIGPAGPALLGSLGVYGDQSDPRGATPFASRRMGDVDVLWLLESDHRALAIVPRDSAGSLWRALEEAGRPFAISCVGREAADRFAVLDRARARHALAAIA